MIFQNQGGLCGCMKCHAERAADLYAAAQEGLSVHFAAQPGYRYGCEKCGNKRCPHHSDHTLMCTGSNEPGQLGSVL